MRVFSCIPQFPVWDYVTDAVTFCRYSRTQSHTLPNTSPTVLTADTEDHLKLQIAGGLAATVSIMVVMRILHKGVAEHLNKPERVMHILLKFGIATLHLCLYWIAHDSMYFILAESILTTATNMIEMLIPLHTKSRVVDILKKPDTVDSTLSPGAQHELNSNRKSVLQRALTNDLEKNSLYKKNSRYGNSESHIELKQTINPVHSVNRGSNSSVSSVGSVQSHSGSGKYSSAKASTSAKHTSNKEVWRPLSAVNNNSVNSGGTGYGTATTAAQPVATSTAAGKTVNTIVTTPSNTYNTNTNNTKNTNTTFNTNNIISTSTNDAAPTTTNTTADNTTNSTFTNKADNFSPNAGSVNPDAGSVNVNTSASASADIEEGSTGTSDRGVNNSSDSADVVESGFEGRLEPADRDDGVTHIDV